MDGWHTHLRHTKTLTLFIDFVILYDDDDDDDDAKINK